MIDKLPTKDEILHFANISRMICDANEKDAGRINPPWIGLLRRMTEYALVLQRWREEHEEENAARIKPCPFCGGDYISTEVHLGFETHEVMTVCRNCGARVLKIVRADPKPGESDEHFKRSLAKVVERTWNTRIDDEHTNQ